MAAAWIDASGLALILAHPPRIRNFRTLCQRSDWMNRSGHGMSEMTNRQPLCPVLLAGAV